MVGHRPGSALIWFRQFPVPSGVTSWTLGRCAAGNRKLPRSILGWSWPTYCYSLHFCTLPILIGPDFESDSNGTTHLIFRQHPEMIFVYSGLSLAIKLAIWDQLGLYCYQGLLRHTLPILPGPDFWCRSDGAYHIALKVLRGNVHRHVAVAVQSMRTICFWGATI